MARDYCTNLVGEHKANMLALHEWTKAASACSGSWRLFWQRGNLLNSTRGGRDWFRPRSAQSMTPFGGPKKSWLRSTGGGQRSSVLTNPARPQFVLLKGGKKSQG